MSEFKTIKFYPPHNGIELAEEYTPVSSKNCIPQWYKDIPKHFVSNDPADLRARNDEGHDGSALSIKMCTPFFQAMTAGYMIVIPEDLYVSVDENEYPKISWKSGNLIIDKNGNLENPVPAFHHPVHFAYKMQHGTITPPGYSVLITHPLNRDDLPFRITSGIQNTDIIGSPVNIGFYIKRGFEGIIKKGTPFAQIIPFQRESWQSEIDNEVALDKEWELERRRAYLYGRYHKEAFERIEYR